MKNQLAHRVNKDVHNVELSNLKYYKKIKIVGFFIIFCTLLTPLNGLDYFDFYLSLITVSIVQFLLSHINAEIKLTNLRQSISVG